MCARGSATPAAAVTGGCFLAAVFIGAPAVSLIGGYYVADLTGSGTAVAASVGLAMFGTVLAANALGLRVSSGFQLVLVVGAARGDRGRDRGRAAFARAETTGRRSRRTAGGLSGPRRTSWSGCSSAGRRSRSSPATSADPESDLPRAMAIAFGAVTLLYIGLAVATIAVTAGTSSRVPLADLIAVGFGRAGRDATAVLAVALTMGTMNVYLGGAAKLAASLAEEGSLPALARRRRATAACPGGRWR